MIKTPSADEIEKFDQLVKLLKDQMGGAASRLVAENHGLLQLADENNWYFYFGFEKLQKILLMSVI
jgi:hypothetical protein